MGGRRYLGALIVQRLKHRHCKRRALDGVGARAQLVYEHKAAAVGGIHYINDIGHMSREGGKRLLYRLLIADIGQYLVKDGYLAAVARGDHQAAHRHH